MKKYRKPKIYALLLMLLLPHSVSAGGLPIDIDAIRPQGSINQPLIPHFSTNLFTPDSQRANEAVYAQFIRRQETSAYLFDSVFVRYEIDIFERIMNAAYGFALFTTPANYSHISMPVSETTISNGLIALVIGISVIVGLIIAFALKKKRKATDVH